MKIAYKIMYVLSADACTKHNIAEIIDSFLNFTNILVDIFLSVVTGVTMIIGLRYLKSLKEKKLAASFSFWSQLKLKIIRLNNYLFWNKEIVNNLYSIETRIQWEEKEIPIKQLEEFKQLSIDILSYLDKTSDQMPAYNGWTEDMKNFIDFLAKIIQYDICNGNSMFMETRVVDKEIRDEYYAGVCKTLTNLIDGIQRGQQELEEKLFPLKSKSMP